MKKHYTAALSRLLLLESAAISFEAPRTCTINTSKETIMFARPYRYTRKIKDIRYDQSGRQLSVLFDAGISKIYLGVPQRVYEELSKATNQNQYCQDRIDGQFRVK